MIIAPPIHNGRNGFGGAMSRGKPSQYYIGFWPCQQADGDDDDEQVTDRSGNGFHATIGALTASEAWANPGALTTKDEALHCARIPASAVDFRFAHDSLIVHLRALATKEASSEAILGNRATGKGWALTVAANGDLQWAVTNPTNTFFSTSIAGVYASAVWASVFGAYDVTTGTLRLGANGALITDSAISLENLIASDNDAQDGIAIGGRGGASQNGSIAGQFKFVGICVLPDRGLPANLADLCKRLHYHPMIPLTARDLGA